MRKAGCLTLLSAGVCVCGEGKRGGWLPLSPGPLPHGAHGGIPPSKDDANGPTRMFSSARFRPFLGYPPPRGQAHRVTAAAVVLAACSAARVRLGCTVTAPCGIVCSRALLWRHDGGLPSGNPNGGSISRHHGTLISGVSVPYPTRLVCCVVRTHFWCTPPPSRRFRLRSGQMRAQLFVARRLW